MRIFRLSAVVLAAMFSLAVSLPASAQDAETLADIRQELTVLNVEIQRLKRELSTTGSPSGNLSGSSVLDRVIAIEGQLQALTAKTEQLDFRINQIVTDGTNRIGDLEFRLVELEGGDISALGETSTLGGVDEAGEQSVAAAAAPAETSGETALEGLELAVGERADFESAEQAMTDGAFSEAAEKLSLFNQTYPGSPLAVRADLMRGRALDGLGDTREAARAYLAAFSGNSTGPQAPEALFELGAALGRLEQQEQACITLAEVGVRFPGHSFASTAASEKAKLGCP
ncbi:tol-pal system protein [Epibacterium ulvae]|uniref:tol-pal system protein n=1 Tax=Epibacterium ulvae TaxID=1156985 RepID=UPI00248FA845|nr:tol-pal system protein [Epibacterium ulvae]